MNQASAKAESPDALTLPRWAESAMGVLQFLLFTAGFAVLTVGCLALMHAVYPKANFLGFALIAPAVLVSIAFHECGHLLGAHAMGMTPYLMQIGPLQMSKRRRGWRVRWNRIARTGYAGFVMAFANPHAKLRRQYLGILAAGPVMNLMVALAGVLAALSLTQPELNAFLWGFAGFNVALALVNLVPRHKHMATDGRQILELCRGFDEDSPAAAFARVCGLSVKGVTADKMPRELLDRIADQPSPYPLFHFLFAINALQAHGQWAQAAELGPLLEEHVAGLSPEHVGGLELLVGALRCEVAFSKAMTGQIPTADLDEYLGLDYDWMFPGYRPRLQALMAVRRGDMALADSLLQQSERHMEHSIDESFR